MKKASFEDVIAIIVGGGLSLLAVVFLGFTVDFDQSSRDEARQVDFQAHKTAFETRVILDQELQPGYTLRSHLADAARTGNTDRGVRTLKNTLRDIDPDANWYWQYNGREGTIPDSYQKPDVKRTPQRLPAGDTTTSVLIYRDNEQ
jgi:hypothetical protein